MKTLLIISLIYFVGCSKPTYEYVENNTECPSLKPGVNYGFCREIIGGISMENSTLTKESYE